MAKNSKEQKSTGKRRGRAAWQTLVEQWQGSGLSQVEFCRRHGLVLTTFRWWCTRMRCEGETLLRPEAPASTAGFVAVRVAAAEPTGEVPLELDLPGGVRLRVPASYNRQSLVQVLRALEEVRRC